MEQQPDVFDRLMDLPLLRRFKPIYIKHKRILLYLVFGVATTVVNFVSLWLFHQVFGIHELIANTMAWVVAVTFAFVTNKLLVFKSESHEIVKIIKEALPFYGGRLLTLLLDNALIYVFVTKMKINLYVIKVVSEIFVIILNYIFAKLIFKNHEDKI